jgi:hypothetical protein
LAAAILLAGAALVIGFILPERWSDPLWYSAKYWVGTGEVHWTAKPTDCDSRQPSDGRACHYKKAVTAYNLQGQPVAGDDVPRCRHDLRTGRNIVSYDGRSWAPLPLGGSCPDLTVKDVQVRWIKVDE